MPLIGKSKSKGSSGHHTPTHSAPIPSAELIDVLALKDPLQWTVTETAAWLEIQELGELRDLFTENSIAGAELLELSDEDMKLMGIIKLGHRKKLLRKIAALKGEVLVTDSGSQISATTSTVGESSDHHEENRVPDRMVAKCSFRGEWHNAKFTTSTTFKQLKKQLEEQFGTKLRIKFCDTDGDHVPVKRDSDWVDCVREIQAKGSNRMKLYLTERAEEKAAAVAAAAAAKEPTAVLSAQARADMFSMFEFILDPVLVISESGIIQYANKRVEAALGYTQADLIGRNISLMCPDDIKPYHDMYLKNYLKTKVSRIIGKGRDVIALKKDGSIHPIHLEVTEKSAGSGKVFFIGIMKEAKAQAQEKSLIQQEREVLYTFTVPAIIIDQTGAIHGFNKAAQDFLGYPLVEVIGKNVSMLMPSPHRELHDQYLKKYLETGEAKVIGVGRNAVAQQKDGTLVPVFLSVTEKRDKEKRFFTGILQEIQHTPSSTPQASPRG